MNIIDLNQVSVGYKTRTVLSDVNLTIEKGEILTLIGPNGAGKSTLLYSIASQLDLLGGVLKISETDIRQLTRKELAQKEALLVTERIRPQLMTVEEVVAAGRYPYTDGIGRHSEEDLTQIQRALDLMQVTELAQRDYNTLSDGQKQRVLIARAICQDPEVLILDEPTSYLDIRYRMELMEVIRHLAEEGITIIMSLHEVDLALEISDRLLCVKEGSPVICGSSQEIIDDGILQNLFELSDKMYAQVFGKYQKSMPMPIHSNSDSVYILSFTEQGRTSTLRVKDSLEDHLIDTECISEKGQYKNAVKEAFEAGIDLIFIGAAGIAVRMIAPYVKDKMSDPAVLVIDEKLQHVIPLLSGHVGGANRIAKMIANDTGAEAVMTTATDVNGLFAIDVFAKDNDLIINDRKLAKDFSAALLKQKEADFKIPYELEQEIRFGEFPPELGLLIETDKILVPMPNICSISPYKTEEGLQLIPKMIIVGMGCRAGKPFEDLYAFLMETLDEMHLHPQAVCTLASIERKKDEFGLIELADKLNIPFLVYTTDELHAQQGEFTDSEMVEQVVGVGNVCERSAMAAGADRLLLRKIAKDGMTLAIGVKGIDLCFM